jgi:uncharacterized phiE125 gp8 family phage protein
MAATLNANALVELDSLKGYVKVPLAETSLDELLRDFINEASSLIENYCNRKFRQLTYTQYLNGARTTELLLGQWPVSAINNLYIDNLRVFGADTLIDPAEYTIGVDEKDEGILVELYEQVFPQGRKNVKIEYVAGYNAFSDVPADLQLACKRTAAYYFEQQQNEDFTETNKSKGDENVTLIDGLPKSAALILENYVRLEMLAPPDPVRNL